MQIYIFYTEKSSYLRIYLVKSEIQTTFFVLHTLNGFTELCYIETNQGLWQKN